MGGWGAQRKGLLKIIHVELNFPSGLKRGNLLMTRKHAGFSRARWVICQFGLKPIAWYYRPPLLESSQVKLLISNKAQINAQCKELSTAKKKARRKQRAMSKAAD